MLLQTNTIIAHNETGNSEMVASTYFILLVTNEAAVEQYIQV